MTNAEVLTSSCVIAIDGVEIDAAAELALMSVSVEQSWSAADRVEIRFDNYHEGAPDIAIGAAVTVTNVVDTTETELFSGEVTAKGVEWSYESRTVVYEGYDARHKLARRVEPTSHKNATNKTVIDAVAGRHRLGSTVPAEIAKATHETFITASSDFVVLQEIAHRTGSVWSLVDGKIVFDDAKTTKAIDVSLTEENLIEFDLRFTPIERASKVEVRGWDPVKKESIVQTAELPTSRHGEPSELGTKKSLAQGMATSWSNEVLDLNDAQRQATAYGRRLRDAEVTGRGITEGNPMIKPGAKIEIAGVSRQVNGDYIVASAKHVYGEGWGSLVTHFRIGPPDTSLAELVGSTPDPARTATHGVTIGVVTESTNNEQDGVVRVSLPLIGDKVTTGWARLMSTGGGKDRGVVFVPEVGDEVLVAFEHGDLNRPYILGTVWNQTGSVFAGTVKDNVTEERRIVSKLGNQVRFIDQKPPSAEKDAVSGIKLEVDDAKTTLFFGYETTEIVTTDRPLKLVNGKASIVLEKDEITIEANKITVKSASGDAVIDVANIKATAKQAVSIKGGSDVKVESSGMATVKAGGILTVKGAMVKVN